MDLANAGLGVLVTALAGLETGEFTATTRMPNTSCSMLSKQHWQMVGVAA